MLPWGVIGEKLLSGDHVNSAPQNGRKGFISRSGSGLGVGIGLGLCYDSGYWLGFGFGFGSEIRE